jgi:HSP20 family protein
MFNLVPWKKRENKNLTRFKTGTDDFFSRFFELDPFGGKEFFSESGWFPSLDLSETKKKITAKAELPGIRKDSLNVYIDGRVLTIKGEKKQEKEEKGENYHRMERSYGSFHRSVELPAEVDETDVDASYKDGVLKVVMKKKKESESKKIEVEAA